MLMDIANTFFSPNGRLQTRAFYRAVIVLVGLFLVFSIVQTYGGEMLAMMFSILSFVFLYCYFCVFAKRLHDGRRTGWFFPLFLIGYFVLDAIVRGLLMPILSPGAMDLVMEQAELMQAGQLDLRELADYSKAIAKQSFLPATISLLLTNAALAYIAGRLRTDPRDNEYGPAPASTQF